MMRGVKGDEIVLIVDNKVGKLEEVTSTVKENGVNIRAISAWAVEDKAFFRLITSDNEKAKEALAGLGNIEIKEVVIVEMPDEVGQLDALASKLKDSNIDISHIYGTTSEPGKPAIVIFSCNDNEKALQAISA